MGMARYSGMIMVRYLNPMSIYEAISRVNNVPHNRSLLVLIHFFLVYAHLPLSCLRLQKEFFKVIADFHEKALL